MASCSSHCQKKYILSFGGLLKLVEVIVGFGCWGLLCFGNASLFGKNADTENKEEVFILTLITITSWIVTCALYIFFLTTRQSKVSLWIDTLLNAVIAVAYAAGVGVCTSSWNFIWSCLPVDLKNEHIEVVCDPPDNAVYKNDGQNLALVIFCSILSPLYMMHIIYSVTKLGTTKIFPNDGQGDHSISHPEMPL